ncbi:sperm-associated antigen 8 isoform X1 [Pteropus medius]|uniref:sperm-associated antigen 8 isoform X1 n=1 Tax=Pteropus vampyrus TaxID=132908 RepID=UPI00196A946C|nr:sperm-associated antigen 8 isoform X1 [Pteropus giganteus]
MESGRKAAFPHRTRLQTSAPQRTCLHLHLHPPTSAQFRFCADSWDYLPSLWQPGSWCLTMETFDFTERSRSRSLHERPSLEGLGSTSEPSPSSDSGPKSALAAATAEAAAAATATAAASTSKAAALPIKTQAPYSKPSRLMDPSSESLLGEPYTGSSFTHKIGNGRFGFKPVYGSCIAQDPCTTSDLSSSPGLATGSSSDPVPGSSSGPGGGSGPGQGISPDSGPLPASDSGPNPGYGHDPELSPYTLPSVRNPGADPIPGYASWNHHQGEPEKQPWKFLQVSEPGVQGLWKPPDVEEKCKVISETLPRGRCLLYNWEEERATNHLDQVPSMQDGSESFFFRHGHQGLLTLQLQSPMPLSTTQKDAYRPPGHHYQPSRGKREAMLEMLLYQQICKEVQAEQEPTRKHVEMESVTHHDYQKELEKGGPPAPTKPHDYHKEQPETFWIQRAPQLPGVSNIKTLDTPFRKNCSFSTPVPLSLGQPLPYEPENNSYQLGEISSLGCQGGGQGGGAGRTA